MTGSAQRCLQLALDVACMTRRDLYFLGLPNKGGSLRGGRVPGFRRDGGRRIFFGRFFGFFFRFVFWLVFRRRLRAQVDPQRTPKSTPGAPKMAPRGVPGPVPKRVPKKVDFLVILGMPGTLKIAFSLRRQHSFHFFTLRRFWSKNGSKHRPKMEPKRPQNRSGGGLRGVREPSQKSFKKWCENCRFWGSLGAALGRLLGKVLGGIS